MKWNKTGWFFHGSNLTLFIIMMGFVFTNRLSWIWLLYIGIAELLNTIIQVEEKE